jgi:hypothetical protein
MSHPAHNPSQSLEHLALEIAKAKAEIDSMRPLYEKLDALTLQFRELAGEQEVLVPDTIVDLPGRPSISVPAQFIKVVDNFMDKNVVFRPAAVRRFEVNTETEIQRKLKVAKAAKKLENAKI